MKKPVQRATRNAQRFLCRCALTVVRCAILAAVMAFVSENVSAFDPNAEKPKKIVSINLCTDELLFRLVPPERIAAVSVHSANSEVSSVAREAASVKKIKGGIEEVLSCQPDLVLGGTFSNRETLRFFKRSATPMLIFSVPKSFDDIYANIHSLAEAVGEPGKGEAIIRDMKDELAQMKGDSFSKDFKGTVPLFFKNRAVFFQSGNYVPGAGTFENAIMEAAGLVNVASELGIKDYGNLSLEQLIEAKPDILIFVTDQTKHKTVRGEVLDHPALKKGLPDVKIVEIPASLLNCGSPASIEAVRILIKETSQS